METINIISSLVIAILCIWAVLTPKVRTSSPCIFGFFIMFLGACANFSRPIFGFFEFNGQIVLSVGIAIVLIVWFYRVEIKGDDHAIYE